MPINPADFVKGITNPYLPLKPGTTLVYKSPDGTESVRFEVTRETKMVMGVECIVVLDKAFADGELHERTFDYFAQDKAGNVWYFGEAVQNLENGQVINTNGSWLAGVNGAQPGIIMQANPKVGQTYAQEIAPGIAEDRADVLSVTGFADVPYGSVGNVLQTRDYTPLEPSALEIKSYARGIGQMLAVSLTSGDAERLVKIEFDGTSGRDVIAGNIGTDELRGHGGNDRIDGFGGDDILLGGTGSDVLAGGAGNDVLMGGANGDVLIGGAGRDVMFGGSGKDIFDFNHLPDFGPKGGSLELIGDFTHAVDDIDLRTIDANSISAQNQDFKFIGASGFHKVAGELRYQTYNLAGTAKDHTVVSGDVTGDGTADFQLDLKGLIGLTAGDFLL